MTRSELLWCEECLAAASPETTEDEWESAYGDTTGYTDAILRSRYAAAAMAHGRLCEEARKLFTQDQNRPCDVDAVVAQPPGSISGDRDEKRADSGVCCGLGCGGRCRPSAGCSEPSPSPGEIAADGSPSSPDGRSI